MDWRRGRASGRTGVDLQTAEPAQDGLAHLTEVVLAAAGGGRSGPASTYVVPPAPASRSASA